MTKIGPAQKDFLVHVYKRGIASGARMDYQRRRFAIKLCKAGMLQQNYPPGHEVYGEYVCTSAGEEMAKDLLSQMA